MKLSVDSVFCKLLKISNNTLQMGSGSFVPEFTIPVEGIMLSPEQLNETMADPLTWRSWYNHSPPALPKPCDWWAHSKGEFPIPDEFEGDWLQIEVTGGRIIEFEADEPLDKEKKTPAFRISKIVLTPLHGGNTHVKFNLHVRPGIGKENLILQEHQHSEVRLSFSQTIPRAKDEKQRELDLSADRANLNSTRIPRETGAADASDTREPETESEANQKTAKSAGPESEAPSGSGSNEASTGAAVPSHTSEDQYAPPHSEHDQTDFTTREPSADYEKPRELTSPSGEVIQLKPLSELDKAADDLSKRRLFQKEAARLLANRSDDLAEFEKGLERKVEEHHERPTNVIDGRK